MKNLQTSSKCLWVARDIAGGIAKGEIKEGEAIHYEIGRASCRERV